MAKRMVHYFEDCGPKNTEAVIDAVMERSRRRYPGDRCGLDERVDRH